MTDLQKGLEVLITNPYNIDLIYNFEAILTLLFVTCIFVFILYTKKNY